jgi:hypothetical protein
MADATASQTSPGGTHGHLPDAPTGGSFTDQLADLEGRLEAASERVKAARTALAVNRYDAPYEATAPLVEFHDSIAFQKPDATPEADRPERERELIEQFVATVKERGLLLRPVRKLTTAGAPTSTVEVVDPSLGAEVESAEADRNALHAQIARLKSDHAADLEAERRKADADRIKGALGGDDGDAIRAALGDLPDAPTAPESHRRHAPV